MATLERELAAADAKPAHLKDQEGDRGDHRTRERNAALKLDAARAADAQLTESTESAAVVAAKEKRRASTKKFAAFLSHHKLACAMEARFSRVSSSVCSAATCSSTATTCAICASSASTSSTRLFDLAPVGRGAPAPVVHFRARLRHQRGSPHRRCLGRKQVHVTCYVDAATLMLQLDHAARRRQGAGAHRKCSSRSDKTCGAGRLELSADRFDGTWTQLEPMFTTNTTKSASQNMILVRRASSSPPHTLAVCTATRMTLVAGHPAEQRRRTFREGAQAQRRAVQPVLAQAWTRVGHYDYGTLSMARTFAARCQPGGLTIVGRKVLLGWVGGCTRMVSMRSRCHVLPLRRPRVAAALCARAAPPIASTAPRARPRVCAGGVRLVIAAAPSPPRARAYDLT